MKKEVGFTIMLLLKLRFLAGLGINDHTMLYVSSKMMLLASSLLAPGIVKCNIGSDIKH